MGGGEETGYQPWWAIDKAAWRERFSVFYRLASISENRTQPLKPWTEQDVEDFIKSDPVHGPRLKLVRQGAQVAAAGAVVGGLTSAGVAMRYSKNSLGAFLAFAGGAAVSWAIAEEGANLALGLYKFDCLESNLKFLDWWQAKTE
ncbi:hypothetical protein MPTK1_3g22720 [Marchantia polymorpha subsp. ruderalis]|uniref:Succinate dehydrogenase subunit 6, mitochondrial n=2 Tax=Marchantia polymorpha TaxID=3197 RepID=A0A176VL72_MARPO|nr:hypothetical protein AXG93_868s1560 [Marchantia polymorpha subsp. ruderalis]PTQ43531.1 hypothetical protein MARPO_0024s0049 [Marchantia polymorpha]BBN06632.1 hypothetical protein Mp_3g22720 [Marchantia polymorpha subsp. ruderalis]|eukprot:PTQ43531.1 hypothetical protein MARPO_0024s0049 [Marchantia polymorpha]